MLQQPLAFVDVETTGLSPEKNEIIELGVVLAKMRDNGMLEVVDKLDLKIHPKHIETADPQALRVNGYNEADWLFATTLEDAMKAFSEKTKDAIFIAHNVAFDYNFVLHALESTNTPNLLHYYKLDTISLAFGILHNSDDIGKYSLRALCQYYEIENAKAHSAFADAYATYEIFKKLLNLK